MRRLPLTLLLSALAGCAGADPGASMAGRSHSATQLCQPQSAAQPGLPGEPSTGTCLATRAAAYPAPQPDGYSPYRRGAALHHLRKTLHHSQERAKSIEDRLAESTALLVVPNLAPALRRTLTTEIEQLREEKIALERAIDRLEREYAAAERSQLAGHQDG